LTGAAEKLIEHLYEVRKKYLGVRSTQWKSLGKEKHFGEWLIQERK
jgi:hypothetical protein